MVGLGGGCEVKEPLVRRMLLGFGLGTFRLGFWFVA